MFALILQEMMIWLWPPLQVSLPVAVFTASSCLEMHVAFVATQFACGYVHCFFLSPMHVACVFTLAALHPGVQ